VALCTSVISRGVPWKWLNGLSLILAERLPSTYPTLCWKVILILSKIRVVSSWTFVPNSGLKRKFRNCTSTVAIVVNLGGRSELATVVGGQRVCLRQLWLVGRPVNFRNLPMQPEMYGRISNAQACLTMLLACLNVDVSWPRPDIALSSVVQEFLLVMSWYWISVGNLYIYRVTTSDHC